MDRQNSFAFSDSVVRDRLRLDALYATGLLDSSPEKDFDRLTELTCRLLQVPVSLVSLVDCNRQFFKSAQGLPEPWASERQTPLSHSFCFHVVSTGKPLRIDDARKEPLIQDNLAISELGVIGYLGIPLLTPDGHVVGSLCAIAHQARVWSDEDVENLSELAALVIKEIELRFHLRQLRQTERALQQRTRELEQKNRDLEQFAHIAAHDLGNPLNTIIGFSEVFNRRYSEQLDPKGKELLTALLRSSRRMKGLLQDLLAYARSGNQSLNMSSVCLSDLIDSVLEDLGNLIISNQAKVQYKQLPNVKGDEAFLRLLFQNLIENAIKYRREVPPHVEISAEQVSDLWVIHIRDNSIGIDGQHLESIFEPFRRLPAASRYPGNGIGLATCKRIVEQHGGSIWVESKPATGSVFHLTLLVDFG